LLNKFVKNIGKTYIVTKRWNEYNAVLLTFVCLPVTEGKNMPMRIVKVVVRSTWTWLKLDPDRTSMSFGSCP